MTCGTFDFPISMGSNVIRNHVGKALYIQCNCKQSTENLIFKWLF